MVAGQFFFCVLTVLLVWTVGCVLFAPPGSSQGGIEAKAWKLIRGGALLVDVRSPSEYSDGHLPGGVNIPDNQTDERISEFGEDKNRQIVLYCRTGIRAMTVELKLRNFGYTNVLNAYSYEDMLKAK